jgi:hypothetical protein
MEKIDSDLKELKYDTCLPLWKNSLRGQAQNPRL